MIVRRPYSDNAGGTRKIACACESRGTEESSRALESARPPDVAGHNRVLLLRLDALALPGLDSVVFSAQLSVRFAEFLVFCSRRIFWGCGGRRPRWNCERSSASQDGHRKKARRNLVVVGFLLSLACMLPILFWHNLTWAAICLSLAFFFSEFTIGPMWAIPMDIAPRFAGSASGLMNTGSALAAIVSPLVAGYVIDKTGNWDLPFIGSIGLLLLGSILAFWMKPDEELTLLRSTR